MNDDQCGNEICLPKICRIDTDCGPGNKCNSQHCIIRCQYTGQCPDGKNCVDDYCSIPPGDLLLNLVYRRCTIITRGSYTFYPLFEDHLCIVTFGLIYDKFLKGKKVPGGEISGGGAQSVELKLRWQFCVHTSTWPEIYF